MSNFIYHTKCVIVMVNIVLKFIGVV